MIPPGGVVSEVYHAQKWRQDVDRRTLSPMYDAGNRHYYIDELARLKNGDFVIPVRWLEDVDKNVFADAYTVVVDQVRCFINTLQHILTLITTLQSVATVIDSRVVLVSASDLQENFLGLVDANLIPIWDGKFGVSHLELHLQCCRYGN